MSMTSTTSYTPLGNKYAGVVAVAISATLSVLSILLLVIYSSWLIWKHFKRSARERLGDRTRGIAFLTSNHGTLFLSLIAGDLLQGIGFAMNWTWVAHRGLPMPINSTCTAQGIFIQMGDLASAFSSLAIGGFVFSIFVLSYTPSNRAVYGSITFLWIVVGVMAGVGPAALGSPGSPFYAQAGGWCWISQEHQIWRLWLHYFWVFLVAAVNLILYSIIAMQIVLRRRRATSQTSTISGAALGGSGRVAAIMLIYPIVYLVTILPISGYRLALLNGKHPPIQYALGAGCVFTLSGTVNCLVYASTRSIVSFSALRRKSVVSTQGHVGYAITARTPSQWDPKDRRGSAVLRDSQASSRGGGGERIRMSVSRGPHDEALDTVLEQKCQESGLTLINLSLLDSAKDESTKDDRRRSSAGTQTTVGIDERIGEADEEEGEEDEEESGPHG